MDLDQDGQLDILSGSYCAGTYGNPTGNHGPFYFLKGNPDGSFEKPKPILGRDNEQLSMEPNEKELSAADKEKTDESMTEEELLGREWTMRKLAGRGRKSCPFPVDLNGDGHLDLVSGNAEGTFAFYSGDEGGKFSSHPEWLKTSEGSKLAVNGASGPIFYDWDNDGDLDLISGSEWGGVIIAINSGSKTDFQFEVPVSLIESPPMAASETRILGVKHIGRPNQNSRVAVGDVNGDGKPDLIVGDRQFLCLINEGVSVKDANAKFKKWQLKNDAFNNESDLNSRLENLDFDNENNWTDEEKKVWEAYLEHTDELDEEFNEFAKEVQAGFVWLYLQK